VGRGGEKAGEGGKRKEGREERRREGRGRDLPDQCEIASYVPELSPPTNQLPTFYRSDALPVTQPTASEHTEGNSS